MVIITQRGFFFLFLKLFFMYKQKYIYSVPVSNIFVKTPDFMMADLRSPSGVHRCETISCRRPSTRRMSCCSCWRSGPTSPAPSTTRPRTSFSSRTPSTGKQTAQNVDGRVIYVLVLFGSAIDTQSVRCSILAFFDIFGHYNPSLTPYKDPRIFNYGKSL